MFISRGSHRGGSRSFVYKTAQVHVAPHICGLFKQRVFFNFLTIRWRICSAAILLLTELFFFFVLSGWTKNDHLGKFALVGRAEPSFDTVGRWGRLDFF